MLFIEAKMFVTVFILAVLLSGCAFSTRLEVNGSLHDPSHKKLPNIVRAVKTTKSMTLNDLLPGPRQ